jgi:hypothetical protein
VLEIVDGLVVDIDEEGQPVGIDIQHASRHLDLSRWKPKPCPGKPQVALTSRRSGRALTANIPIATVATTAISVKITSIGA